MTAAVSAKSNGIADRLIRASRDLCDAVGGMRFGAPVAHVYNPLDYARPLHEAYLQRFGHRTGRALLLGMNPGPWGMAQTGVPFGEVAAVRDWMGLKGDVRQPREMHPKRPIQGLACGRSEVSGRRLWGWAATQFGSADAFFKTHFVLNYCPLMFMLETGANLTPDKLITSQREPLIAACDESLRRVCELLEPRVVIGIGGFAARRAETVLSGAGIPIGQVLHPSPASPAANRGWAEAMTRDMAQWISAESRTHARPVSR